MSRTPIPSEVIEAVAMIATIHALLEKLKAPGDRVAVVGCVLGELAATYPGAITEQQASVVLTTALEQARDRMEREFSKLNVNTIVKGKAV